jgi:hypothetical protein
MEISIVWHNDQFNVNLASAAGKDPFIEIKGARIVDGSKGPFVSWPATKNASTGKWWSHCYGSDAFNAVVLSKAQESRRSAGARPSNKNGDDGSIPF